MSRDGITTTLFFLSVLAIASMYFRFFSRRARAHLDFPPGMTHQQRVIETARRLEQAAVDRPRDPPPRTGPDPSHRTE